MTSLGKEPRGPAACDTAELQNAILRCLPPHELRQLMAAFEAVELKPRRVVHYPNLQTEHAYFVESGLISVLANAGRGKTVEVWPIGPEGLAGFPVILGERTAPHRRVALLSGRAWRIAADDLRAAYAALPGLREVLLEYVQAVLIQTSQIGVCNANHPLVQRLARWLIMAQDRCQIDDIQVTHDVLARLLGVRRASLSRALMALEQRGAVQRARQSVRIVERSRLFEDACVCYRIIREADEWLMRRCGNYREPDLPAVAAATAAGAA